MRLPNVLLFFLWIYLVCVVPSAVAQYKEIDAMASNLGSALSRKPNKPAAVWDFTDLQGNVTELGRFLAEELSTSLSNPSHGVPVIDRTHLRTLLKEYKLASTGLIDPSTLIDASTRRKLGEISGAQILIVGTITPFGDFVRCTIKALDVGTAQIEAASTAEIPRTKTIDELLSKGISGVMDKSASSPTPGVNSPKVVDPPDRTPSDNSGNPASVSLSRAVRPFEMYGITFVLNSCRFTGSSINCNLQLTNNGRDRTIYLDIRYGRSRMVDQNGREHIPSVLQLGGRECRVCSLGTKLVNDVPFAAALTFENASDISRIPLLEIGCGIEGEGINTKVVQFRDIPVSTTTHR